MPLPMVHLGVAIHYLNDFKEANPAFFLGSIAPDSIHMRKETSREDKKKTHFVKNNFLDLEYLQCEYKKYMLLQVKDGWKWFVRGYFVHILTDEYWKNTVYKEFEVSISKQDLTPEKIKRIYYLETDQIDFNFYRSKDWKEFAWDCLTTAAVYNMPSLLSDEEINYWRWRTVHWFDLIADEHKIEPEYVTEMAVNRFIENTSEQIKKIIESWDEGLFSDVSGA